MNWRWLLPWYWPMWIVLGMLKYLSRRDFGGLVKFGSRLGAALAHLPLPQREVVRRNLAWCFPTLDETHRQRLLVQHFREAGITLPETALAWFADPVRVQALARFHGLEEIDRHQAAGRGVILLAAHFTTLEIGARLLATIRPMHAVYKPSKNALLTDFFVRYRGAVAAGVIASDDIRSMVKVLKSGGIVWYAPDQAYRGKGAQMVPLFGIPAATNTATSRLARMTGAAVLPYFVERLPGALGYEVRVGAAFEHFPSDDAVADTVRHHQLIEAEARRNPAQYLWLHKRFKDIDPAAPDRYRSARYRGGSP